ncbi:hypothetical protein L596_021560 [Steinernema carpocapsae]|uniref:Uncharacterized protein n=1 Tax=Steinernema carpocapsae TaxID=34508 RepID=A0A4U5MJG4_STECR|nr:hypothetical protein L596_021560 [Steinernema carpocapsae]
MSATSELDKLNKAASSSGSSEVTKPVASPFDDIKERPSSAAGVESSPAITDETDEEKMPDEKVLKPVEAAETPAPKEAPEPVELPAPKEAPDSVKLPPEPEPSASESIPEAAHAPKKAPVPVELHSEQSGSIPEATRSP